MSGSSPAKLLQPLRSLDSAIAQLPSTASTVTQSIARYRDDAAALRFHLERDDTKPSLIAMLGGTGTGKSTIVNRLLNQTITAASARRTFTAGCVAIVNDPADIPPNWLGIEHITTTELPARGEPDVLAIATLGTRHSPLGTLIDCPDLDGDHPEHHAQADRAFRWATRVVFVVSPEKYQMTELLPYYRLAKRYGLPATFVMNKCQESAVLDDYRAMLATREFPEAALYVVPRDDAPYEAPKGTGLIDLRAALAEPPKATDTVGGLANRATDLCSRVRDHIIAPLRVQRRAVDTAIARLDALASISPGIDASPLTLHLQKRMQQRSVLYLMGPQRVMDRARQLPSLLARLPRAAWDYTVHGTVAKSSAGSPNGPAKDENSVPDFRALMADAWAVVRTRIDDAVRASPELAIHANEPAYASIFLPVEQASTIADEELADLTQWLEAKWNTDPRDTRIIRKVLNALPGAGKLSGLSEAAPYLLAVVVATHHAFFGPVDLLIMGGYGLAAWMTERATNEVTARTRATNTTIEHRFEQLARRQVEAVKDWLQSRAASERQIAKVEEAAERLEEVE